MNQSEDIIGIMDFFKEKNKRESYQKDRKDKFIRTEKNFIKTRNWTDKGLSFGDSYQKTA